VEPRGLEPLTPCLQSGGPGLVKRHSRLANREQAHPETLGRAFVAAVSCCRFGAQSVLVQRCEHCARFPSLRLACHQSDLAEPSLDKITVDAIRDRPPRREVAP
jgi:hypothetical protein